MVFTPLGGCLLLLSRFAVIPAVVARIASIGPDPDTRSLALVTYRTILFHMPGLLLFIHVDRLSFSYKKCSWTPATSPGRISAPHFRVTSRQEPDPLFFSGGFLPAIVHPSGT
jgi:hypothetical protein